MNIEWHKVTWLSQTAAIVLALVIFGVGFWIGEKKGESIGLTGGETVQAPGENGAPTLGDATYSCGGGKTVHAIYKQNKVVLYLSDGRNMTVPQTISADGGRYANDDESFVFWSKGTGAFISEAAGPHGAAMMTYANCTQAPIPE